MNKPLLILLLPLLLPACAFLEAAGDVEIPSDAIPHAQFLLKWPNVDQLVGATLQKAGGGQMPPGFPATLADGSMAHIQGLMTIDGECRRTFDQPALDDPTVPAKNLHVEVVNCGIEGRCTELCKDDFGDPFRGIRLKARVHFNLVSAQTAAKVTEVMKGQNNPEMIAEIRLRFSKLAFVQNFTDPATGKTSQQNIVDLFSGYELGVGSAYLPGDPTAVDDDTPIVKQRYLSQISPETPQRFELDPTSEFSLKLRKAIVTGEQVWVAVYQRIDVPQQNLYAVRMNGGGVDLDFQPEIVISFIKTVTGAL